MKPSRQCAKSAADENPALDISSLIDVSFLLLIYFLATSTLDPREADLDLSIGGFLPQNHGTTVAPSPLDIAIDEAGRIEVNSETLDTNGNSRELPLLKDRLRTYAASVRLLNAEPEVTLRTADAAKNQRLVDVLNVLADRQIRIERLFLEEARE